MSSICVLDMETYYDRDFSLSKMQTDEYVRSNQFETIGCSFKFDGGRTFWIPSHARVEDFIKGVDWSDIAVVAQNCAFDGFILSQRYGVKPMAWLDTLGMSRALFPHEKTHSLKAQAERMGIGAKGDEVLNALGKRYKDFTPAELARYGDYCVNDVELTHTLFHTYMGMGFPKKELQLIDLTMRMFVNPVFELDSALLVEHLQGVRSQKLELLETVRDQLLADADPVAIQAIFSEGLDGIKKLLMSNEKFATALQGLGVTPPRKISATTGKEAWAFAKTDEEFKVLAEHPDERVQAIVAARLGNKTTLEETRTEKFIAAAARGPFPVPLRYYGAHSGRWCLTGDHEVLTASGWVRLDTWGGEPIRQWDAETKAITWCTPTVSSFAVDEHIVEFNSKYHRAAYTKEHRLPIRKRHTADAVKDITAGRMSEMAKKELYVSGYAKPSGAVANLDQLRLVVAMHADGYNVQDHKNNMVRFRFAKARKVTRLVSLLDALHIPYTTHSYQSEPGVTAVIVRGADAPDWLRSAKVLPLSFYSLSAVEAQVVVDELPYWDGYAHSAAHFEWCGKDQEAATIFATLAHLCGYRTITALHRREDMGWADVWKVRFTKTTTITEKGGNATWAPFTGTVYCPTVDTGYFLCRRKGSIFVTGNSGEQGVNMQNLPARGPNARKIKKAIMAPPGHVVIDCDSTQIEARTLAWLAGQEDLVQTFRDKQDVYKLMASKIYGIAPDQVDKTQRQVGKTVVLGAGYGVGHVKLQMFLKTEAGVEVPLEEAKRIIDTYRSASYRVVEFWKRAGDALHYLRSGQSFQVDAVGLVHTVPGKGLPLPNGLHIQYPDLRQIANDKGKLEWVYTSKGLPIRIYGGKVVENLCQAIARQVVAEQMLRVSKRYKVAITVHDAIGIVAHEDEAAQAQAYLEECMIWNPSWATGLPLACESGMGKSYGDC